MEKKRKKNQIQIKQEKLQTIRNPSWPCENFKKARRKFLNFFSFLLQFLVKYFDKSFTKKKKKNESFFFFKGNLKKVIKSNFIHSFFFHIKNKSKV